MTKITGKTIVLFSAGFLFFICLVTGCATSKNPEKVAKNFLSHFYKCEYDEAKKYGTAKTRQIIDMMDQLVVLSGQKTFPADSKVVMLGCETKGDSAICNYLVNDVKNEILLLKTDGSWLVDLKKESKNKTGEKNSFFKQKNQDEKNNKE